MSTAPTQHHLDANGGRLYYEVRGSGPLLLVVGQPMTSAPFAALADDLAADHTVVTYDPHGVGESSVDDPSLPITPEIEADDLAAIVDELGLGPAAMMGTSGGAVAGLAFASRHPGRITTLIAHEPPVADLLPDAAPVRSAVDAIEDTYRSAGSGGAWGAFASLVMHQGLVPAEGVPPAAWPPPGAPTDDQPRDTAPPEPSAKQQADDELFFLRMLKPFTRYAPDVVGLEGGPVRVRVAVGAASGAEVARRSAEALAERLGQPAVVFPSHQARFMEDPAGFATAVREVLAAP
jgi:pimeloyl-ACP methyl ester carboxylesterase